LVPSFFMEQDEKEKRAYKTHRVKKRIIVEDTEGGSRNLC